MSCHELYRSSLLVFFLLSCYVCLDLELNQEKVTTNDTLGSYFGSLLRRFSYEKGFNLFYDSAVISLKQDATLPSWDPWNLKVNEFTQRRSKHKRSRRPTQYYANSVATTCLILQHGDIEINPIPVNTVNNNLQNRRLISASLLNARSLRNKSSDIYDYIVDSKLDLCAITETWLNVNDDAVRNEVCPGNYILLDQPRAGHRRGGGTAFMYRESLFQVKKLDGGELNSFEFSEYSVRPKHQNLRVIVIYRPPYSDGHKVLTATFLNEFANYIALQRRIITTRRF